MGLFWCVWFMRICRVSGILLSIRFGVVVVVVIE